MIRSKHITTTFVAVSSLAATFPAGAAAHHIVGHDTLAAVQEDVQAAADEARRQVSSVQQAIENTGAHTRRHLQETVDTQVQSVERSVARTRAAARSQVEEIQEQVASTQRAVNERVAYGQGRVQNSAAQGRERAQRTSDAGRRRAERAKATGEERAQQERSRAERRAERTREYAESEYAIARRRAQVLAYRITRELETLVAGGSVRASAGGGEYSVAWKRTGGCWTVQLSSPLDPPDSRLKRRTGKTVEPVDGHRTSADTSSGDVTASTGC